MLAPQPSVPDFDPSESTEDVRAKVKAKLAEIRERAATGRLNSDSTLFKLKQKLTELGSTDDVQRRRDYLAAAEPEAEAEDSDETAELPAALPATRRMPPPSNGVHPNGAHPVPDDE